MKSFVLTAAIALTLVFAAILLAAFSAYLIIQHKTKKPFNFSNAMKLYLQSFITMLQAVIFVFFCYKIELALENAKKLSPSSSFLDVKYTVILLLVGLIITSILILLTLVNLTILLPADTKRKIKAYITSILPTALKNALSPVTHKMYSALKRLARKNCENLVSFIEEIKPSDNNNDDE